MGTEAVEIKNKNVNIVELIRSSSPENIQRNLKVCISDKHEMEMEKTYFLDYFFADHKTGGSVISASKCQERALWLVFWPLENIILSYFNDDEALREVGRRGFGIASYIETLRLATREGIINDQTSLTFGNPEKLSQYVLGFLGKIG